MGGFANARALTIGSNALTIGSNAYYRGLLDMVLE